MLARRRAASARTASRAALVNSLRSSRLGTGRTGRVRRIWRIAASRAISATTCPRSGGTVSVSGMPVTTTEPSRWTSTLTLPAMAARSVRTTISASVSSATGTAAAAAVAVGGSGWRTCRASRAAAAPMAISRVPATNARACGG
jgi:hypothetical protein